MRLRDFDNSSLAPHHGLLSVAFETAIENMNLDFSPDLAERLGDARRRIAAGIVAALEDGVTDIEDLAAEGLRVLTLPGEQGQGEQACGQDGPDWNLRCRPA